MYVNQIKIIIFIIIFAINKISFAVLPPIKIVALFSNKVVIIDQAGNRKILNIGDSAKNGLTLISANSAKATFKDTTGKLITIGINEDISFSYSYNKSNLVENTTLPNKNIETIIINKHNQYIAPIIINNQEVISIIDTGANYVTLNSNIAKQLKIPYKNPEAKINVYTASDKTEGYKIVIPSIKLGNIELRNINAIVLEGTNPEIVLLGMSFLKKLDLQYLENRLELKERN